MQYISYDSSFKTPNFIDLRDFCLSTNNQYNTPYCVGYSVAAYFEVFLWKKTHIPRQLNAEKIYKVGREYKADTMSGTRPEYCLYGLENKGFFTGEVIKFQSLINVYTPEVIKMMVHTNGVLITGFNITDEWYCIKDGKIECKKDPKELGMHCVLCCGYCDKGLYIQNSWGIKEWGNYGYAILPWELVTKQFCYGVFVYSLIINEIEEFLV